MKSVACVVAAWMILAAWPARTAQAELTAHEQVRAMKRGINILGYDPVWHGGAGRFRLDHLAIIKQGGFDTVRVNLQAFAHMDANFRLDPGWVATLDRFVAGARAQKLTVILDEHDFDPCGRDAQACKPRLTAFWRQVATHFRDADDGVVFEILNEPNGQLTEAVWNDWAIDILAVIRATNPSRNVIIGPVLWNNIDRLEALDLPNADRHIIVTVHYYLPMEFTHQGAPWMPAMQTTGISWGTAAERLRIKSDFARVQRWAKAHDRPMLLGEFGAYDKGEMASRVAYTSAVAREAEALGWSWAYWQFDKDFIAYDINAGTWVKPIHDALVPGR